MADLLSARITLPLLLLAGCMSSSPCDLACEAEAAAALWKEDASAGESALLSEPDPVRQIATLRVLVEAHPEALASLCERLSGEVARECRQLSGRPHLWETAERTMGSLPTAGLADPWQATTGLSEGCEDDACRLTGALRAQAAEEAAGWCRGIDAGLWRDECFFRAAEGRQENTDSVQLCLGAGRLVSRCLGHLSRNLATPALSLDDAEGWQSMAASISQASQATTGPLASRLTDRMWAEVSLAAYSAATRPTGTPLDHTPPEARPHILAALALRLVSDGGHSGLTDWSDALQSALEDRSPSTATRQRPSRLPESWQALLAGEEALPWVAYLRDQRRTVGEDEAAERAIVLLEANARSPSPDPVMVADALTHASARVRWTAARTITGRLATPSLRRAVQRHPDPLIQARAQSGEMR